MTNGNHQRHKSMRGKAINSCGTATAVSSAKTKSRVLVICAQSLFSDQLLSLQRRLHTSGSVRYRTAASSHGSIRTTMHQAMTAVFYAATKATSLLKVKTISIYFSDKLFTVQSELQSIARFEPGTSALGYQAGCIDQLALSFSLSLSLSLSLSWDIDRLARCCIGPRVRIAAASGFRVRGRGARDAAGPRAARRDGRRGGGWRARGKVGARRITARRASKGGGVARTDLQQIKQAGTP